MVTDPIPVNDLCEPGQYKLIVVEPFGDTFLCRIRYHGSAPPRGAAILEGQSAEEECFVAFSRLCTHLGCHVAPDIEPRNSVGQLPALPGEATFKSTVVCPCHFSNFDLAANGLTTLGPATDCLPQIELVAEGADSVRLVRWMRIQSVPYGVPFRGTTNQPPEHS